MATKGKDTTIEVGTELSKKKIGILTSISLPELTQEAIDVTHLESVADEFIPGRKASGEVGIEGFYTKDDVGQLALKTLYDDATTDTFTITIPDGGTLVFTGFPTSITPIAEANEDDALGFSATIKISGEVTYTLAP